MGSQGVALCACNWASSKARVSSEKSSLNLNLCKLRLELYHSSVILYGVYEISIYSWVWMFLICLGFWNYWSWIFCTSFILAFKGIISCLICWLASTSNASPATLSICHHVHQSCCCVWFSQHHHIVKAHIFSPWYFMSTILIVGE